MLSWASASYAAQTQPTITAAQIEHGKEVYGDYCSSCHGEGLQGQTAQPEGLTAQPLKGAAFLTRWSGLSLDLLVSKIDRTMPANATDTVDRDSKIDVVAYILANNGLLSGVVPLPKNAGALAALTIPGGASTAPRAPTAEFVCLGCHSFPITEGPRTYNTATGILHTPHATKGAAATPFGQEQCNTCHGESAEHATSLTEAGDKRPAPTVVFKGPATAPVEARNAPCLSCHEGGKRMEWHNSQHDSNAVACVSCHAVHVAKDPVLVKATQPEICFSCHAEQRALSLQFSHHPIREGEVVCADCHNPHGSPGSTLLKEIRVTDTCYNCHADKRGPTLWEHQPVREDCTNCHNPHGSVNPRLLKEKVPFLCLDCHAATNDMGGHGISARAAATGASSFYLSGDRSCLNCHSQIHGSNSPSGSTLFR